MVVSSRILKRGFSVKPDMILPSSWLTLPLSTCGSGSSYEEGGIVSCFTLRLWTAGVTVTALGKWVLQSLCTRNRPSYITVLPSSTWN